MYEIDETNTSSQQTHATWPLNSLGASFSLVKDRNAAILSYILLFPIHLMHE